jgi:pyruvate dehydrogenase (quinone)
MATTAADVLIESLIDWDVEVIFGLPGDGINGIMEALRTRQDKVRFVQCRHEESAAFMACAYAKFTGKLGVCVATSGPGGIHLLNGLYDAKLDGQPVLALTGLQFHDLIGTFTQQDVALDKLYMDVAAYNERIMGPTHVENVVDLACRTAPAYRTVAHISFPVDLQELEVKDRQRSKRNVPHHTSHQEARGALLADDADLDAAAKILNDGKKVAILVGRGALGAARELEQTAARLGAPIVKALLGKAVIPDDSPYTTGGIGLLGTRPSQVVMENCDTLLMVGTSFPYIEFLPGPKDAKGVQIRSVRQYRRSRWIHMDDSDSQGRAYGQRIEKEDARANEAPARRHQQRSLSRTSERLEGFFRRTLRWDVEFAPTAVAVRGRKLARSKCARWSMGFTLPTPGRAKRCARAA